MRHIDFFNGFLFNTFAIKNEHLVGEIKTRTDAIAEATNSDLLFIVPLSARWTHFPISHLLNP